MKQAILVLVIVLFVTAYANAGTWTTLDYPGAYQTEVQDISGDNVVGWYQDSSGFHGFLYNGGGWTGLPINPSCIDGSTIVGKTADPYYETMIYNLTTGSLTQPSIGFIGSSGSSINGISGNWIIGVSQTARSFLWNTNGTQDGKYIFMNYPGAGPGETHAQGISGNSVVGHYYDGSIHGFLYNISTQSYTALNYPGGKPTHAYGVSGNNIVGHYNDGSGMHGFLYNGTNWTTFSYPGAMNTYVEGISGNNVVGWYNDGSGSYGHGFIYTIPEPASLLLLGLGGLLFRYRK